MTSRLLLVAYPFVMFVNKTGMMVKHQRARGDVMRLYLDNCCYNRPYDDQSTTTVSLEAQAKLRVQEMIREGEIELVSSFMLW